MPISNIQYYLFLLLQEKYLWSMDIRVLLTVLVFQVGFQMQRLRTQKDI